MPKIDTDLAGLVDCFSNPSTTIGTMLVADEKMAELKLRRRDASQTHHNIWYLSIGETGQNPHATFYGHKFTDCLVQAMKWRGTYVKHTKVKKPQAA